MILLIFICSALQNPLSARGGATKNSEQRGGPRPPPHPPRARRAEESRRRVRAPRRRRERGLPGSRAQVAGPQEWPRRDTPLPVPRPPSASLLAQGASALLSPRANRPPRSHRFLNHCRSIYWEQTNSPFWKRFNCWLDGWGAAAGGRAGPRGTREGACGKKGNTKAQRHSPREPRVCTRGPPATGPPALRSPATPRPL